MDPRGPRLGQVPASRGLGALVTLGAKATLVPKLGTAASLPPKGAPLGPKLVLPSHLATLGPKLGLPSHLGAPPGPRLGPP